MNISQHTFFAYKWKLGYWRPSGSGSFQSGALTHWFYPSIIGLRIFSVPKAIELYGSLVVQPEVGTSVVVQPNVPLLFDGTVLDSSSIPLPSLPYSFIIY